MNLKFIFFITIILLACSNQKDKTSIPPDDQATTLSIGKNYLTLKINGKDWIADNNIWGAYHPKGYNKAIIISGSKGKKDKNEQPFNLNLYNTSGPGVFHIKDGNTDFNVVQLANLTVENALCGSMMGFDMKVTVTKASTIPDIIEATFEGQMTCGNGEILNITNGKFYYHE